MGYPEKRGDYWRARYKIAPGKYGTVQDTNGATMKFSTRRAAEQAANDAEAKVRAGAWRDPRSGRITFGDYVNDWYERQDLAVSTMQTYKHHIEEHLLPAFEHFALVDITRADIDAWEKRERTAGYADASVRSWRKVLHLVLADAVEDGRIPVNPATKRRGRGRRAGRTTKRGPEKIITSALGVLLIAERAALLSGRDDEFVAIVTTGFTGMRWGELVGLETRFIRQATLRVEWQLYELDNGVLYRCPPKDDSQRTLDLPGWLSGLLSEHITRTKPKPCPCHGFTYVFRSHSFANGAARTPGPKLVDVARRAGVSTGTVSAVLNEAGTVRPLTRSKVETAIAELGYVRGATSGELAPHWRRNGFATWLFQPAVTGWYPRKAPSDVRPVPLLADPWPGVPARGRNAAGRAEACWTPISKGLTPHGLRHSHRTHMEELAVAPKLMDERMGHDDGSIGALYTHITPPMRQRLLDGLTEMWEAALEVRRRMAPGSPVAVLDRLLRPG